jgi:hypothetical protein
MVSVLPGVALVQVSHLVNPWGLTSGPPSPIWVGTHGSGSSSWLSEAE